MMLSLDANFRLKRRAVSNDARDPGLIRGGGGFFVESKAYYEYILKHADQDDVRSACCVQSPYTTPNIS